MTKVTDSAAFFPVVGALLGAGLTTVLAYQTRSAPTLQPADMGLMALGTALGAAAGWGIQHRRGQQALPEAS